MNITRDDFVAAARRTDLSPEQADLLWQALCRQSPDDARPRFDAVNVLYYLGALLVIGAMGWFVTNGWDGFSGWQLALVAVSYGAIFLLAGANLWSRPFMRVPAGLLLTIAVGMVPLAVFGIEKAYGFWPAEDPHFYSRFHPYIDGSWVVMELATVLAGLFVLRRWRFPFLTAPIAYSLWYLSMDLPRLLLGHEPYGWDEKRLISVIFGAVMLVGAYLADLRGKKDLDFAYWGYLFGLASFWGGLTAMDSNDEFGKFVYCLINLGLVVMSLILRRRVFIVFGSIGIFIYIGHLAYAVFKDSVAFPFIVSLLGIGVIVLGFLYQRNRKRIEQLLWGLIAPNLQRFVPPHARGG